MNDDPPAPDEISAPGKDADRGHAAGDRPLERRVFGPERVLRANARRDRVGQLVEIVVAERLRNGRDAHVRVRIDDARRDELAVPIDHEGPRWGRRPVSFAHPRDLAAAHQDVARLVPLPRRGHHRGVLHEHGRRLPGLFGLDGHPRPRFGGGKGVGLRGQRGGRPGVGRPRARGVAAGGERREPRQPEHQDNRRRERWQQRTEDGVESGENRSQSV